MREALCLVDDWLLTLLLSVQVRFVFGYVLVSVWFLLGLIKVKVWVTILADGHPPIIRYYSNIISLQGSKVDKIDETGYSSSSSSSPAHRAFKVSSIVRGPIFISMFIS